MGRLKESVYKPSPETKNKGICTQMEQLRMYGKANAFGILNLGLQ